MNLACQTTELLRKRFYSLPAFWMRGGKYSHTRIIPPWFMVLVVVVLTAAPAFAGNGLNATDIKPESQSKTQKPRDSQGLPLKEIRALAQAYRQIKAHYVTQTDDKILFEAAIAGMVSALDSHSEYLNAQKYAQFRQDSEGDFAGIGVSLADDEAGLRVVSVVVNSPAAKAGLVPDDRIVSINGQSMKYIAVDEAIGLIGGEVGTIVKIGVLKLDGKKLFLQLHREIIHRASVHFQQLPDSVGYLRIDSFNFETTREFEQAIKVLNSKKSVRGLIIDLRNNPGGIIDSAIAIADLFIDNGILIQSVGRTHDSDQIWNARKKHSDTTTPLVLLIDANTASAAEILTAALKGHQRAVLIGKKTWGKGSIQTIYELNDETAIKLTSSHYLGPTGQAIDEVGLTPDIEVESNVQPLENANSEQLVADPFVKTAYNVLNESVVGEATP